MLSLLYHDYHNWSQFLSYTVKETGEKSDTKGLIAIVNYNYTPPHCLKDQVWPHLLLPFYHGEDRFPFFIRDLPTLYEILFDAVITFDVCVCFFSSTMKIQNINQVKINKEKTSLRLIHHNTWLNRMSCKHSFFVFFGFLSFSLCFLTAVRDDFIIVNDL